VVTGGAGVAAEDRARFPNRNEEDLMVSGTRRAAVMLAALAVLGVGADAAAARSFDLEGHRGTRGLRPENTLPAFGKALQIGVTTLELDTGVTKDGVVVVSHERLISSLECQGPYVGKLIHELTYAQIQKLDCGTRHPADPSTDPFVGTQEAVPGTHMPSLAQVFQLVNRYGADRVQFDIETKRDPTVPKETVGPTTFAKKVIAVIKRYHMTKRSVLQSFDWSTLQAARKISPRLRRAALAEKATIFPGTPWTGGIDIKPNPFDGDLARVVKDKLHAQVLSVNYPDITDKLITASHQRGLTIIPWTVDDPAQMAEAIDRGLDGLITDYPDKASDVMDAKGLDLPEPIDSPFDIEGHRGARAYRPENTLSAFRYGLDHGVDTLELDTGLTKDGVLVVSHNRQINGVHCHDTAPVTPGDPLFPYAGKNIKDLTLAQIKTLDCGFTDPGFAKQVRQPNERMPTLQEVFDLVASRDDSHVRFNIETKISPLVDDTVPYDVFTAKLVKAIEDNGLQDRAMIQSFDWRTIMLSKQLDPRIDTVALIWQFSGADCDNLDDECSLEAVQGDPSVKSPWTNGLDWWQFRDVGKLVRAAHADVDSPNWQVLDPNQGTNDTGDFNTKEDPRNYHGPPTPVLQSKYHLRVVPYTVDDEAIMQRVIDLGVDGIISDDPDLLGLVAKRNGLA
jgi:glycerophosphoryl diester phosphodiesterase